MKTTIYLTRHGETKWNVEGRLQGHMDSDLTELGVRQAGWLGNSLQDVPFDAIYTSISPRAQRTAEIIRGTRGMDVIPCEELKEIYLGTWEGRKFTELEQTFPDEHVAFWNAPHRYQPSNGGESFVQLRERVIPKVKAIEAAHQGGTILIVTHAVALKTIMAFFKGDPLEQLWSPPHIHPTSLNKVVTTKNRYHIELHGDISHYEV
ncbi:histidine phosphatase family protein [Paenibacillus lignilyticus]|uniref:Histidine phosphatase family protein n=1 Tax=Paenibacillus lignilyticus TaxID=1172615 RepID=A0ABS5CDW8_9BACL|nr:histidine phosphatase family protein [Paenibacillus lignilyticus]MBP3964035.1 histidine phosphatase family protein [Paenibacillus lignilyticus]